jgi:hypothetical protein
LRLPIGRPKASTKILEKKPKINMRVKEKENNNYNSDTKCRIASSDLLFLFTGCKMSHFPTQVADKGKNGMYISPTFFFGFLNGHS